jgi:predicted nucleic acid-binding protein
VFCSTWDIISETLTLLRYRLGFRVALVFLNEVKPGLRIIRYGDRAKVEAETIFRQYGRDHRLSFCDAISFVVVTTLQDDMPCLASTKTPAGIGLTMLT